MRKTAPFLCLLLSGFASLVYEVCWIRKSALVFGSTTLATSTVLAVFFAGLALGSYAFGRLSASIGRPMRGYAVLEVGVAVLGVLSLALFPVADHIYGSVYRSMGASPALLLLARAGLVALILLPGTAAMGATLPLVVAHAARSVRRPESFVAIGYAINTLGAAAGAAATGLVLIPKIGMARAIVAAAIANLAAASIAAGIRPGASTVAREKERRDPAARGDDASRRRSPGPAIAPAGPPASTPPPARARQASTARNAAGATPSGTRALVTGVFFLTGFTALANEVLWTRYLSLLMRNTVYTFTVSLTVVLVGIVIGSLIAAPLTRRPQVGARAFAVLQALIAFSVLWVMLLPPAAWQRLGAELRVYFLLLLPPAVFSGASFPLAVRLATRDASEAGYEVGRMAAVNIAGGIAGSLWAGFAGVPVVGLQVSVLVTTALSLASGVAAWLVLTPSRSRILDVSLASVLVVFWLAIPRVLGTRVPQDFLANGGRLVAFKEGVAANVAVVRTSQTLQLQIDRWWQGQDTKTHQIMAAHVPMILHPHPRTVLLVGAGTGQTASRFLMYPIERLDVVDIEPRVFDVIPGHFDDRWLTDPRTRLIKEDGRNVVAHADRRYDVISLEVGQVFRPGVASFYTAEFYRRARARLERGGLVCQFVPLPFLTPEQFRGVVATFTDVFPDAALWYNTAELLMIGSGDGTLALSRQGLARLGDPKIQEDLHYSHWGGPAEWLSQPRVFLSGFLCGPRGLHAIAAGAPRYADDRPILEYETSGVSEARTAEIPIATLLREHLDPVASLMEAPPAPDLAREIDRTRERNLRDIVASALTRQAGALLEAGRYAEMRTPLETALRENPDNGTAHRLLAAALEQIGRADEARAHYETAARIDPADPAALGGLGAFALVQGRVDEARPLYVRLLALRPEDAEAHNNFGIILANGGDLQGSIEHFKTALRINPDYDDARRNLERSEAALRRNTRR